jgi:DNA polymerase type B, organellar and viral
VLFDEIVVDPTDDPGFRYLVHRRKDRHRTTKDRHKNRDTTKWPFIAVDGEGGGAKEYRQQNYLLMCARGVSDHETPYVLFDNNKRLTTKECLDFILALPRQALLVGFFFDYDVTQILRDLPVNRLARLLSEIPQGMGLSPFTEWGDYILQYVPKQFLRVGLKGVKGSVRTINETGGFFQKAFAKVIADWEVADEETIAEIEECKKLRPDFTVVDEKIHKYCLKECELLAAVMEKLRTRFEKGTSEVREKFPQYGELSLVPNSWRGAGYVAGKILQSSKTPKTKDLPTLPGKLGNMMIEAYYGGHFEISRTGLIDQPIYEYDINSAYPSAMPLLPCPEHTQWKRVYKPSASSLYVADITFEHPVTNTWGALPFRDKKGHLYWPLRGSGVYWSPEIEAARKLHQATIRYNEIWQAKKCCHCQPFSWVEPLYDYRKSLGRGMQGYPIKLGLNAMYGKLAQRKGGRTYYNLIHAGLITAMTRAKLLEAVAHDPEAVVMLATDGVYSTRELPLPIGDTLGTWEQKEHPNGIFIVQPGLYWFPDSPTFDSSHKTRGIPKSVIQENSNAFADAWVKYREHCGKTFFTVLDEGVPANFNVPVYLNTFTGIKLALSRGKPLTAGCWNKNKKDMSFNWTLKRDIGQWNGNHVITRPIVGNVEARSEPYDPSKLTEIEEQNLETEGNPDFIQIV